MYSEDQPLNRSMQAFDRMHETRLALELGTAVVVCDAVLMERMCHEASRQCWKDFETDVQAIALTLAQLKVSSQHTAPCDPSPPASSKDSSATRQARAGTDACCLDRGTPAASPRPGRHCP